MLADFHFLRPLWLLALLALPPLLWFFARRDRHHSQWEEIGDPELLAYLGFEPDARRRGPWLAALVLGWLVASLAAAGPAFRKAPEALYERSTAQVILFDLSRSMLSGDLKPTRLEQARFKLMDLLDRIDEGQVALVAYAGEPFIVSPLTDDANTVRNMVAALDPSIMPAPGSEADEALALAATLLERVGDGTGQILVMTDSATAAAVEQAAALAERGISVSVLGVGTPEGAPIALPDGGVLTAGDGRIVVPQLDERRLAELARAGDGRYVRMTSGPGDLERLVAGGALPADGTVEASGRESARWRDEGPWLVLLLLPLAALAFRRGVVLALLCAVGLTAPPPSTAAADGALAAASTGPSGPAPDGPAEPAWAGLWRTPEQRAEAAMAAGAFARAARLAEDPLRRGNAHYRAGDYEAAARAYARAEGADGAYNLGNALAQQERFEEAIGAYERALEADPEHADARHNKELLEELLEQQRQQQDQDQDQEQEEGDQPRQEQRSQAEEEGEPEGEQEESEPRPGEEGDAGEERREPQPVPLEEAMSEEERQALEQWLRRIPDDPGGLLRRKFLLEYQRRGSPPAREEEDW